MDAIKAPREVAIAAAFSCLTEPVDPDSAADGATYYAELLLELEADCSALREHLFNSDDLTWETRTARPALGTLAALTLFGHDEAEGWLLEYAKSGTHWALTVIDLLEVRGELIWPAIRQIVERRAEKASDEELIARWQWVPWVMGEWSDRLATIPRFAELFRADFEELASGRSLERRIPESVQDYLDDPEDRFANPKWLLGLRDHIGPHDMLVLERAAFEGNHRQMQRAFELLHLFKRPQVIWAACQHHLREPIFGLDRRQSIALDLQGRRLPADLVLPQAREWLDSPHIHQRWFAETAMGAHAELCDRADILERIEDHFEPFHSRSLAQLVSALAKFKKAGPLPVVEAVFEKAPGYFLRSTAAEALANSAPKRFEETFAFECLWDSYEQTRRIAGWSVRPTCPRAARRIEHLRKRPEPEPVL